MRNRQTYVLLAALGWTSLALAGCGDWRSARHEEEKVDVLDLPIPVQLTVEEESKSGALKELERRTADGKTTYLATVMIDGEERETLIGDDGMVIRRRIVEKDDDR